MGHMTSPQQQRIVVFLVSEGRFLQRRLVDAGLHYQLILDADLICGCIF